MRLIEAVQAIPTTETNTSSLNQNPLMAYSYLALPPHLPPRAKILMPHPFVAVGGRLSDPLG